VNQNAQPTFGNSASGQRILAEIDLALESDLARAAQLAEQALASGFEHPKILNLLAYQLEEQGRYPEALRLLDRAAGLDPTDVLIWNAVGLCLVKQDRRRDAVAAFDHALALNPSFPQGHLNLGRTLEQLGDHDGARGEYEWALRLAPDYADPLAGLASLATRAGDWTAACDFANRALALQPFQPAAISSLASAELNEKAFEAAEQRLRALIADPGLDRFDSPSVHCLLGDALDGLDRPDEAFAEYLGAKAGFKALYQHRYEQSGMESQLDFAHRLTAYFETTPAGPWSKPAPHADGEAQPARAHAFLVGFPRSGTTLLENVLASHADMTAIDERVTLQDIEDFYLPNKDALDRLASLGPEEAAERRAVYWTRVRGFKVAPEGKIVIDKMPLYTTKLPIIAKLFPGVKVLFAQRDPRDVVLSCFRRAFQMNAGMYQFVTLEGTARYYDAVMSLAEVYRRTLPLDMHVIRYENLVTDFEGETRAVCEFLGADWSESLSEFANTARDRQIRTPSAAQVRQGLYATGAGQWRRYAAHLEPVMPILRPWIERFGYEPD
jgi:tetratricopeptide (TPR) repeat protein